MVNIERIHESLPSEKLESFEQSQSIILPKEYREFLLKYNGGYPDPSIYKISDEQGESIVNILYGIGSMYDNLEKNCVIFDEILEIGFIPIGDDPSGNQICIGINKKYDGQIFHWAHDEEHCGMKNMYFLASNFNDFLDSLYKERRI
ncbi:SMI1/KNR4 family protein [Priestia endophytica]|uniref:SMI1/KNR4 family protein n=1 Tax=Priestia endophytica TaxID=135735 RepID=UPI000DCA7612|nr:SMI1/KNR4 family protein [Priestia endophytica]RAS80690.1 SMI1/KNR4 family protein [Priestia endophytica]